MPDQQKPYWWYPTEEQDIQAMSIAPVTAPNWYEPPSEQELPVNRENELNLPSYFYPTDKGLVDEYGKFDQSKAIPINRNINSKFNYSSDFGATGLYTSYAGVDIVASMIIPGQDKPLELGELQTISYSIHRENSPVRVLGRVGPRGFVKGPRTIAGSLIFTQFDKYAFYKLQTFREHLKTGLFPLSDMLPPFDVTISFANEMGSFSKMRIYGITIVDEGSTMSVDDLITEQTFTYMARGIQPMVNYIPEDLAEITEKDYLLTRSVLELATPNTTGR